MKKRLPWLIGAAVIVLLLAAFLLIKKACIAPVPPERAKIFLVGLDGADWDLLDPLIRRGKLPVIAGLRRQGAWARLHTFSPTLSEVVWTSIATGKTMQKHGIVEQVYIDSQQRQVPYSNAEKKAPAIWEIFSDFKKKSLVLNWLVTYPPDPVLGVVVSDYYADSICEIIEHRRSYRLFTETVHPNRYFKSLQQFFKKGWETGQLSAETVRRYMDIPDYVAWYLRRYGDAGADISRIPGLGRWPRFILDDFIIEKTLQRLLKESDYDLLAVYSHLPDVFLHFATLFLEPQYHERLERDMAGPRLNDPHMQAEFAERMAELAWPLLRYKERLIARLQEKARRENAYLIVVSDHGFTLSREGYNHFGLPDGTSPPDGILLISGPGVAPGRRLDASVFDVTPTILYILGKPIGRDMDGRPLQEAFTFRHALRYAFYKKTSSPASKNPFLSNEKLDALKSLGYIR